MFYHRQEHTTYIKNSLLELLKTFFPSVDLGGRYDFVTNKTQCEVLLWLLS